MHKKGINHTGLKNNTKDIFGCMFVEKRENIAIRINNSIVSY